MTYKIAVAGKGGAGKTTIAASLVYHLIRSNKTPVLAVDADPNSNLDINLGIKSAETVADLREEILDRKVPEGMSKAAFLELKLQECLAEGKGFDLLTMGRPEGQGCYCAANSMLRTYLSKIAQRYKYVVMDNEAGLEHLSRRTTDDVDALLIICNPTLAGVRSAVNVLKTSRQVKLKIKNTYLIANRASKLDKGFLDEIEKNRLELTGTIPDDTSVFNASETGKDVFSLPESSPFLAAIKEIMRKTGII
jgi:CO dehydrogenase maturation factor